MPRKAPVSEPIDTGRRIAFRSGSFGKTEVRRVCTRLAVPVPSVRLLTSCGMANRPIMAVRKCTPAIRLTCPKVKRWVPITGSWPMVTMASPMAPDSSPLTRDLAAKLQMMVRPKNTTANISSVRNSSATSASSGAIRNRKTKLTSPPTKLAVMAMPSARPASPRSAMG